ncbi:hypothetical protein HMPREF0322_03987 [Desulfitobacterium hafniense DP7]|uniref:Uncharacterized protein n=1 Tax=Desulfitobacterium hafniense DP7 TaxID=537010 RepID=G9XSN9_DESHA|nr:hypothetical protein HMPREF0322_03987 [Desulfitobacterium hafniense DP7]
MVHPPKRKFNKRVKKEILLKEVLFPPKPCLCKAMNKDEKKGVNDNLSEIK